MLSRSVGGMSWNAVGARATSFWPMPRKPPTPITYARTLASLSNRMSLTSPIFSLLAPITSVPLNLVASIWSGFCSVTNLPDAWALEDEALGEGDDCIGLALGDGDDWLGDCVVEGEDWDGEGACAKAEPANSAAAAVLIMNLVNIAGLRDDFENPKGKMLLTLRELPRVGTTRGAKACSAVISVKSN